MERDHGFVAAQVDEEFAVGHELGEFRGVRGELPVEAIFLQREIAEVFAIGAVDESVERGGAGLVVGLVGDFGGEFVAAETVQSGFEGGTAQQARPAGVGARDESFKGFLAADMPLVSSNTMWEAIKLPPFEGTDTTGATGPV